MHGPRASIAYQSPKIIITISIVETWSTDSFAKLGRIQAMVGINTKRVEHTWQLSIFGIEWQKKWNRYQCQTSYFGSRSSDGWLTTRKGVLHPGNRITGWDRELARPVNHRAIKRTAQIGNNSWWEAIICNMKPDSDHKVSIWITMCQTLELINKE